MTVRDAVVGAVAPVIAAAEQEQNTAQQHLNADKSTEQSTQSQLNALYANIDSRGPHGSMLAYAQTLQHEITQQQRQISADHHAVLAAKAKVAAGNVVAYGQQAQSDQRTARAAAQSAATSYSHLAKILPKDVRFKPGGQPLTQTQIDGLSREQRSAYFDYLSASARATSDQAKVYADNAEINKSYAQLQLYASAPKNYGTIAQNAVDAVNKALAPVHLQIAMPAPIDVGKAKANLAAADQAKASVDAYWDFTKAAIPAQTASNNVAAAQAKVDVLNREIKAVQQKDGVCLAPSSPLMTQLNVANKALAQAKAAAGQPEAALGVAYTYMGKVQTKGGVMRADAGEQHALSALDAATAAYAKWRAAHPGLDAPGNKYELAVNRAAQQVALAKQQVAQAKQQASLATGQFNAAYAQLYAAQQQAKVAADWQKVASATSCSANPADSPYAIWKADKEAAQAATEVAQEMGDTAKKQGLDYQVAADKNVVKTDQQTVTALTTAYNRWNQEHPGIAQLGKLGVSVNDVNPYAKGLAHAQAALSTDQQTLFNNQQLDGAALSQINYDNFILSLPENLQDPQTTADKQKLAQEVNQYTATHQFQSGPVDGQQAISQVKQDLSTEKQYLASRGLLESGWDWLTGGNHSGVETYVDNELAKLQTVQREEKSGQLTDIQYQTDLHNIMHNYGQTYLNLTSAEQAGDAHWRVADDVFRGAVATVVGIAATAASGGDVAVGFLAGFATYQAIDGAENIKTVAEGGNIMDDSHISLGGLIGEAITGHASMAMLERAGVDTANDVVSSLAAAGGSAIAGKVTNLVVSKALGAAADTAASEAVGNAATAATKVGIGTSIKATALSNLANQGIMSAGQLVNTAIDVQANGGLFNAKGGEAMLSAAKDQAFYAATAPIVGGVSGALPAGRIVEVSLEESGALQTTTQIADHAAAHVAVQAGTDFATNAALTFGDDTLVSHRGMTADDWITAGLNTAPGTMQHLVEHPLGLLHNWGSNQGGSPGGDPNTATASGGPKPPQGGPTPDQPQQSQQRGTGSAQPPDLAAGSAGRGGQPPRGGPPVAPPPDPSRPPDRSTPPPEPWYRRTGHAVAGAGRATGHAVVEAGRATGHAVAEAGRATGYVVAEARREVTQQRPSTDPLDPAGWRGKPVYVVHVADNTTSVRFAGEHGTEATVDPNKPWEPYGGKPPSEVRIIEQSGPPDAPTTIGSHLLIRNPDGTGTYIGTRRDSADQSDIHYVTGSDNPFRMPAAPDLAPLDLNSPDWVSSPIYRANLEADGTTSLRFGEPGAEAPVDPNAPLPSEMRIFETSTGPDGRPVDVAAHFLTRNPDGTYSGIRLLSEGGRLSNDGRVEAYQAGRDPFSGLVAEPRREAPPPRPVVSSLKKVGQAFDRGLLVPTLRSLPASPKAIPKAIVHTVKEAGVRMEGSVRPGAALRRSYLYPSTVDREDGGRHIPANTDPRTGGPHTTPEWHGDGTMGIAHIRDAAVERSDMPPLTRWAFGHLKPPNAETTEETARAIVIIPTGLGRLTVLNHKFKAPEGAVKGVRTGLGEAVARFASKERSSWSPAEVETLGNYVAASMRSNVLGIRAVTRDAFWKRASQDDIMGLVNAYRRGASPSLMAPQSPTDTLRSDAIKLAKLNFNKRDSWDKEDVYRLFSLIDKSLESGDSAIKGAAERIVRNVTSDDVKEILTADRNSKYTGSKTTKAVEGTKKLDQLSGNTVATFQRILDTAGPEMMKLLRERAEAGELPPELAAQAEKEYADLQSKGLQIGYATGIVTKPAKDAIDASLRDGAQSADETLRTAANTAQKDLSGLQPGGKYTQAQLEAYIAFMKVDQKSNWVGGSKIDGSLRGKLSPHAETIEAYLAQPKWTRKSVRFWNAYLSALRDAPDEQMRIAGADASKLRPKAGDPTARARAVWGELSKADKASWWQPNMASVNYPSLSRAANAVTLKDAGIHAQSPVNAIGEPAIGALEDYGGKALDRILRSHSVTPFGSAVGRALGAIGLPLLNHYYEANPSDNPEFFIPKDPNDPSKGYIPNITENPTNKKKPWKLNADLTLYVQPHLEFRPGPTFPLHFFHVPISVSFKLPYNRIKYPGVDPLGRPGHMDIVRGQELTNRQAQFLYELAHLGATPLHGAGKPANEMPPVFGIYASSPPWRVVTTPLFKKLGLSDNGDWWRTDSLGRLLPRPAPAEKVIPVWQERRDVGTEIGVGPTVPVIPGAGPKQPKAALGEFEHTVTPKIGVPTEIEADPKRAAEAAEHAKQAWEELATLATKLEQLAGSRPGAQWPGSAEAERAIKAIRAAGAGRSPEEGLSPENTEELIIAMNEWKKELGGSLPRHTREALGNSFWAPGRVWKQDQADAAISMLHGEMAAARPASLTALGNRLERTVGGASDKAKTAVAAIRAAGNDLNAQTHEAMNDAVAGWFRSWGLRPPSDILDLASWGVTDGMAATLQSRLRTDLDLTLPPDQRSAFRHSSPATRQVFGAVAISNGRWNRPTWGAVEALVNQTLDQSSSPALRTRAQDLRNAMRDGPGNWQITDAQNTAMDAFFAQDIRDGLRAGTPTLAGTGRLEIAIETMLRGAVRPRSA